MGAAKVKLRKHRQKAPQFLRPSPPAFLRLHQLDKIIYRLFISLT
jgi:hypothetical protein